MNFILQPKEKYHFLEYPYWVYEVNDGKFFFFDRYNETNKIMLFFSSDDGKLNFSRLIGETKSVTQMLRFSEFAKMLIQRFVKEKGDVDGILTKMYGFIKI